MNTQKILCSVCMALSVLAVSAAPAASRPAGPAKAAPTKAAPAKAAPAKAGRPASGTSRRGGQARAGRPARAESRMSPEDARLLSSIEEAHGMHELSHLFAHASHARNPDVRSALVDALEEQGPRGASLLAAMIADPDEDVAESAFTAWSRIVDDMPPRHRVAAIHAASQALSGGAPAPQPGLVPVAPQPVQVR